MIKFEEHDGLIFRMLDKPTPLTPDAEMPCLVRLIQDDSPMGRHNKFAFSPLMKNNNPIIIDSIKENAVSIAFNHMVFHYSNFEIIGYPVADGSKEWAWYQMMQGEAVTFFDQPNRILRLVNGYIQDSISDGFWNRKSGNEFLSYASSPGWQIYKEPKPEPIFTTGDKVTDGVIEGTIIHIEDAIADVCPSTDEYKIELRNLNHIPESPKQDDVEKQEEENIIHGHIPADMNLKYFHLCKFKVGDWVEWCGGQYMVESAPPQSGGRYDIRSPYDELGCSVYPENITRKLDPSEVVIRIGCLSGTVSSAISEDCFLLAMVNDPQHRACCIDMSMLDTQTRELVEGLLEAQERGDIK